MLTAPNQPYSVLRTPGSRRFYHLNFFPDAFEPGRQVPARGLARAGQLE